MIDGPPLISFPVRPLSVLPRMNEISYLARASSEARSLHRIADVRAAIDQRGFWEDFCEWRISTVTHLRIESFERESEKWFRVHVACDHVMSTECPTLERAVEFLGVYERLIMDLFWTLGWPSWAERGKLKP